MPRLRWKQVITRSIGLAGANQRAVDDAVPVEEDSAAGVVERIGVPACQRVGVHYKNAGASVSCKRKLQLLPRRYADAPIPPIVAR
jgi:hypothetical protein